MQIQIKKTDETFDIQGVMCRRWHGVTARGYAVDVLVQSVRPIRDEDMKGLGEEFGAPATAQPYAKAAADSDAVDSVRRHVARLSDKGQANVSIAGLKAVLAEIDTLKAAGSFADGIKACQDSLRVWMENLDSRHDSHLLSIFREAVDYLDQAKLDFQPGFHHAEGGFYQLIGPGQVKMTSADEWRAAYFYINDKGERFATGPERWVDRFKLAVR